MIPRNVPPSQAEESELNDQPSYDELNSVVRQNLLMQLMATRPQQHHGRPLDSQQYEHMGGNDGSMTSTLNEHVIRHHYQQHESLPRQQDASNIVESTHDLSSHLRLGTSGSRLPTMPFHMANLQHGSLGALSQNINLNQPDDDLLSMMMMANRQASTPPFFVNQMNTSECDGGSSMTDTGLHRAYNQSITQALISNVQHPPIQHFGDAPTRVSGIFDSNPQIPGARQSVHNHPSYSSIYQTPSQQGPNRGFSQMFHLSEGIDAVEVPDRIMFMGMSNPRLGLGMIHSSHELQQGSINSISSGKRNPNSEIQDPSKSKKRRSQRKQATDKPRRALSAYNLFFSAERTRILRELEMQEVGTTVNTGVPEGTNDEVDAESCRALQRPLVPSKVTRRPHRKTHGKIGFQNLAKTVASRWKQLSPEQKQQYQYLADEDLLRHKNAMEEYLTKQATGKLEPVSEGDEKCNDDSLGGDIDVVAQSGDLFDSDEPATNP